MRPLSSMIAILASLTPAGFAYAQDNSRGNMRISVNVPESCHMQANTIAIAPGHSPILATITEACNSGRGFRVMASHRPLLSDERVEVIYAGNTVMLASSGVSDIVFRSGPSFEHVAVAVNVAELRSALSISFGMTAI